MKFLVLFFSCFFLFIQSSYAAINYSVTPIKYELDLAPGESVTLPASIRNNGDSAVTLPTTASDFQTNGTSGVPSLVRRSELVFPDQQLSSWISIQDSDVTMNPGQEVTTNFTIAVPTTATPGGHYGAVLFKNAGSESATSGNIDINVDYGIIILVNVSGEVVVKVEIEEPIIENGSSGNFVSSGSTSLFEEGIYTYTPDNNAWFIGNDESGKAVYQNKDDCPLGDFTPDKFDGKCFGPSLPETNEEIAGNISDSTIYPDNSDFDVSFTFPIKNTGNTHIKPTGKITLKDENGNIIKAIGKETIANERGAVIGENIVDYIPVNDQGGNVLPSSKRIFESQWKGFPYKTYDDEGNQIVHYWSPSEYYTAKNKEEAGFLMFWERVSESRQHKLITAEIELTYYDENGNPIEFTSAQEFPVQYVEEIVSVNPYIILAILLIFTAGLFIWGGIRWWVIVVKNRKCWNCKEKIKSHWETCPHCAAIQNKKKHKAYQEQKKQEKKPATKKTSTRKSTTRKTPVKKAATKKTTTKKTQVKK